MPDAARVAVGCAIFAFVWILLLKDRWSWLPLGRAMSAQLGASLYVATGCLSVQEAYAAVNLSTIALLTGCMLVSAHAEKQGMYAILGRAMSNTSSSPLWFLGRVSLSAAVCAALLTNDTTVLILTDIVVQACVVRKLHPAPFLLALATSANIGASCSPIGSPQNMIIAVFSGIPFLKFLAYLGIPAVLGTVGNMAFIALVYRRQLFHPESYQWDGPSSSLHHEDDGHIEKLRLRDAESLPIMPPPQQLPAPGVATQSRIPAGALSAPPLSGGVVVLPATAAALDSCSDRTGEHGSIGGRTAGQDGMTHSPFPLNGPSGSSSAAALGAPTATAAAAAVAVATAFPVLASPAGGAAQPQSRSTPQASSHSSFFFHVGGGGSAAWSSQRPPPPSSQATDAAIEVAVSHHRRRSHAETTHGAVAPPATPAATLLPAPRPLTRPRLLRTYSIYALLAGFPLLLVFSDQWMDLGWTTLLCGALLCVLDGDPPEPLLARVDGSLLFFFSGLFIVVAGFNATGVPQAAWELVAPVVAMDSGAGVAVFTLVVLVGSNLVSNVPLVLLMAPKILAMQGSEAVIGWSLLAWVSTVAGNLTLLGSVANLIVAERAKAHYELTFLEYARVGVPTTLVLCAVGTPLVWALTSAVG